MNALIESKSERWADGLFGVGGRKDTLRLRACIGEGEREWYGDRERERS
jgi:hypothetical protein